MPPSNIYETPRSICIINDLSIYAKSNTLLPQYFDTADQEKSLDRARFELMSEVHKHLQNFSPQSFIKNGQLSKESLHRFLFQL